ncbi:YfcE family phosphodiesterase OS=Lysinibacillus sphaericus OX=1421 GN=LS41612_11485 PE=3 SV=1 [Lysinibacillus sphaericus]
MITYLPNNKVIVNPGSVGLPAYEEFEPFYYKMESGNPLAKYVIVEKIDNEYSFEQISIPYNTSLSIFYSNLNNRKDWATALEKGKF